MPPHQCVVARQVEWAMQYERGDDDHSRAQVAARSGIRDQGHFTHHFQQFDGVAPKQFR
jgi:hypothetical protein